MSCRHEQAAGGTRGRRARRDRGRHERRSILDPSSAIDPDDLPDGLVVADETGRVICFNAAAARITAIPAGRRPRPPAGTRAAAGGPRGPPLVAADRPVRRARHPGRPARAESAAARRP